ncbi:unnamed protein product [Paramecium sonneborni]|uniref:Transmembrane protein n=1 Tax=Paramecium sonneborni TaxID=65129 RepID=A0A8S1QNF4_9CILI|nr:unnamed protein product [Paramecium sonneborni]
MVRQRFNHQFFITNVITKVLLKIKFWISALKKVKASQGIVQNLLSRLFKSTICNILETLQLFLQLNIQITWIIHIIMNYAKTLQIKFFICLVYFHRGQYQIQNSILVILGESKQEKNLIFNALVYQWLFFIETYDYICFIFYLLFQSFWFSQFNIKQCNIYNDKKKKFKNYLINIQQHLNVIY